MLCEAVIEMAIHDIRENTKYKEDAIEFLKSERANLYLLMAGSHYTGKQVLSLLEKEGEYV